MAKKKKKIKPISKPVSTLEKDLEDVKIPFDLMLGVSIVTEEAESKGFEYSGLTQDGSAVLTFKSKEKKESITINIEKENAIGERGDDANERKSYLPMPLMHEVDFWINLPCYSDHPTLGVNGALINATMWNASNTTRFLRSPASAPPPSSPTTGRR